MPRFPHLAPPLLLLSLLTACTGTEETLLSVRLNVLTDGGSTLRALSATGAALSTVPVTGGVQVEALPSPRRFLLVRTGAAETRAPDGSDPQAYPAPGFTPVCLTQAAQNVTRDRLLLLSDCSGTQRVALYRETTLVWSALLPTFLPPMQGSDTPPIRLAVQGDVGIITRPRLSGGSEVLRVAVPAGASTPVVSTPLGIPAVYDLAPYGADILAATDTGVQRLRTTGEPDPAAILNALGTTRYDRLWTSGSPQNLLAAWRSNRLAGTASRPLRVWNGVSSTLNSAPTVAEVSDLRDVTFPPDGFLYTLQGNSLIRYNTLSGLQGGGWAPTTLQTLTNPISLTWTVPPTAP